MPPTAAAKAEKEEQLWSALKKHILSERERKKQEQEAEVEEERLRKEREAREKRDVMSLGETREQIQQLEDKLNDLIHEKQQLFLQLKKVLNEDENRKKQQQQKDNEMYAMHAVPQPGPHAQHFMPQMARQLQPIQKGIGIQGQIKRQRSPSPTPQHGGYYKSSNNSQYQHPGKMEDGRRGNESARAVLWNKPNQYATAPGTLFYSTPPPQPTDNRGQSIIFSNYPPIPLRQQNYVEMVQSGQGGPKPDMSHKGNNVYINLDPGPQVAIMNHKPPPQVVNKITLEKLNTDRNNLAQSVNYHPMRPIHMTIPNAPAPQQGKMPSITQGYNQPPPPSQQQFKLTDRNVKYM